MNTYMQYAKQFAHLNLYSLMQTVGLIANVQNRNKVLVFLIKIRTLYDSYLTLLFFISMQCKNALKKKKKNTSLNIHMTFV